MIAAGDLGLEISPDAVDGPGGGSGLVDVVNALTMQLVFELGTEVGALE